MRVKSNFLSKSAKLAFGLMTMCGVLFTSCYEKDDLDINPPVETPADATYSISGSITNYLGEAVNANSIVLSGGASITKNDVSSFAFSGVQPGDYELTVKADGYQDIKKSFYVAAVAAGNHSNTRVDVVMAEQIPDSYLATYSISGLVKDQTSGAPVKGATVSLGESNTTTAEDGSYSLSGITAGSYVVTISADEYPMYMAEVQLAEAYANEENVVINKVFNYNLNKASVIVDKYSITATAEESDILFVLYNSTTKEEVANGRGSLNYMAVAGSYYIEASKEGNSIDISKIFTLGSGENDSQAFAWSVSKVKETGSTIVITDPAQPILNQKIANKTASPIATIIPEVTVDIPANAVDDAMALNINIVPVNTNTDLSSTATVLSFRGTPSGTTFNSPLKFTFPDEYGLGNMRLFYLKDGKWVAEEGDNGIVKSDDTNYTAYIPHFSDFLFGFNFMAFSKVENFAKLTGEGNYENNTGSSKTYTASYEVFKGARFVTPVADLLQTLNPGPKGAALVEAMISNLVQFQYGVAPAADFETETVTKSVVVPAGQALTAATAVQGKTVQEYVISFTTSRTPVTIAVEIAGASVLSETISSIGHGHGTDWNAGGGISVAE